MNFSIASMWCLSDFENDFVVLYAELLSTFTQNWIVLRLQKLCSMDCLFLINIEIIDLFIAFSKNILILCIVFFPHCRNILSFCAFFLTARLRWRGLRNGLFAVVVVVVLRKLFWIPRKKWTFTGLLEWKEY